MWFKSLMLLTGLGLIGYAAYKLVVKPKKKKVQQIETGEMLTYQSSPRNIPVIMVTLHIQTADVVAVNNLITQMREANIAVSNGSVGPEVLGDIIYNIRENYSFAIKQAHLSGEFADSEDSMHEWLSIFEEDTEATYGDPDDFPAVQYGREDTTYNVVTRFVFAYRGELPGLQQEVNSYLTMIEALKAAEYLIKDFERARNDYQLGRTDFVDSMLKEVRFYYLPGRADELLTDEHVFTNFPDLIPIA